jgi:hypothetical protein
MILPRRCVDHEVLGPQVLVQHLLAVQGLQAGGHLLDERARRPGPGAVVAHPLRQGLALEVLQRHEQVLARRSAGRARHMGAVDGAIHSSSAKRSRWPGCRRKSAAGTSGPRTGRWPRRGQIDMAARAGVQLAQQV